MSKGKPQRGKKDPTPDPEVEAPQINYGSGEIELPGGATYCGEWMEVGGIKKRHGKGTLVRGPEEYSGDWKEDAMDGVGEYRFSSGASYSGAFVANRFHGEGRYAFADGATYNGEWFENSMHGYGVYTDPDGNKFEGAFFNGMYNSGAAYVTVRPQFP